MNWKKSSNLIFPCLLIFSVLYFFRVCTESQAGRVETNYTVEALTVDPDRYGYRIKQNEEVLILQPLIPGVPGKLYFHSPDDAIRVGKLVVKRLKAGQSPTITYKDIKRLGVTVKYHTHSAINN